MKITGCTLCTARTKKDKQELRILQLHAAHLLSDEEARELLGIRAELRRLRGAVL